VALWFFMLAAGHTPGRRSPAFNGAGFGFPDRPPLHPGAVGRDSWLGSVWRRGGSGRVR